MSKQSTYAGSRKTLIGGGLGPQSPKRLEAGLSEGMKAQASRHQKVLRRMFARDSYSRIAVEDIHAD